MTVQTIPSPMPTFNGQDGKPLSAGYVYFGEANQDPREYPVDVFFDAALSAPAPQPLRTSGGYLYRNGTPTNVWMADGYHSVLVLDSSQRQVYYAPAWVGPKDTTVQETTVDRFSGTGAQTAFTLSATPASENSTTVFVGGVYVQKNAYDVAGNVLTFAVAPVSGTNNIEVNITTTVDFTAVVATVARASNSATAAAASAASAATSAATSAYIYAGTYAADPTTRPGGSAIQTGDVYFNSTANLTKRYNGATWVASDINTANLAASSGASLVGYVSSGTGAVARTLQAKARDTVSVYDFGAVGNGVADDTTAITSGLTYAGLIGAVLYFPPGVFKYTSTITLAAGYKIKGAGWGENPLGSGPTNSSILSYAGTAEAIKITGSQAEAIGLALIDVPNTATHAVRVLASTTNLIEGARVDVYVNGFTAAGAWAFTCEATDGAIAYGDFNVRARSCSNYFKVQDNNDGRAPPFGFVNSNSFRLVCSGGETGVTAPGYALYVDGGNNNRLTPGSVLEPVQTQNNHIKVVRGSISGVLRVEGSQQAATKPLIDIAAASDATDLTLEPSTAYILNRSRSSKVNNRGAKSAQPTNPNRNLYKNAHWSHNRDGALADWTVTGAGVTTTVLEPDFVPGFRVLQVTVPAGIACTLAQPIAVLNTDFSYVSHGAWVKYDSTTYPGGQANVSTFTTAGTTGSGVHTGDNTYQYLGQAVAWNTGTPTNFQNKINLTGGSGSTVFFVTCPMLCFGNELPDMAAHQYDSIKRMVVVDLATIYNAGNNEIILPVSADAYLITSTVGAKTIARINNTGTFFPLNKEITLLFNSTSAGSTLSTVSALITARANITTDQYSVVRLLHDKAGQWRVVTNY